jgi:hypothetical protein
MAYNGSIELISGIKQANNGEFPLVEASSVEVSDDGKRLNTALAELEARVAALEAAISNS